VPLRNPRILEKSTLSKGGQDLSSVTNCAPRHPAHCCALTAKAFAVQVLWWDGLGKLTQSLGPSEAGELLTVLQDKGVCCRTDVYEVQLAAAAEAAGIA